MKTRTVCKIPPLPAHIDHSQSILCLGSCFAQHIGTRLRSSKFDALVNPLGITYNPVSLFDQCHAASTGTSPDDRLFVTGSDQAIYHYQYHSDRTAKDRASWREQYQSVNESLQKYLTRTDWCIITLGTAWVYTYEGTIVANCHKQPSRLFSKRLLTVEECTNAVAGLVELLPDDCQVMLTVSPVRHIRDGLVENNRSKARLIDAMHIVVDRSDQVHYFPAYELVVDDLRDYRYYAEDLVHPSHQAVEYVWSEMIEAGTSSATQQLLASIAKVKAAMQHRPRWPVSQQHQDFLSKYQSIVQKLAEQYGNIDWSEELEFF